MKLNAKLRKQLYRHLLNEEQFPDRLEKVLDNLGIVLDEDIMWQYVLVDFSEETFGKVKRICNTTNSICINPSDFLEPEFVRKFRVYSRLSVTLPREYPRPYKGILITKDKLRKAGCSESYIQTISGLMVEYYTLVYERDHFLEEYFVDKDDPETAFGNIKKTEELKKSWRDYIEKEATDYKESVRMGLDELKALFGIKKG